MRLITLIPAFSVLASVSAANLYQTVFFDKNCPSDGVGFLRFVLSPSLAACQAACDNDSAKQCIFVNYYNDLNKPNNANDDFTCSLYSVKRDGPEMNCANTVVPGTSSGYLQQPMLIPAFGFLAFGISAVDAFKVVYMNENCATLAIPGPSSTYLGSSQVVSDQDCADKCTGDSTCTFFNCFSDTSKPVSRTCSLFSDVPTGPPTNCGHPDDNTTLSNSNAYRKCEGLALECVL
ncbi:hypothetical protein C8R44DRAFT_991081 [Mycena epipterygia]|nr:hypothetical protein C8R44DRAFT_991081 [Mycena epipterygia]